MPMDPNKVLKWHFERTQEPFEKSVAISLKKATEEIKQFYPSTEIIRSLENGDKVETPKAFYWIPQTDEEKHDCYLCKHKGRDVPAKYHGPSISGYWFYIL